MQSLNKTILSLTILSSYLLANTNPFIQKLPFKEAIIEYTLLGNQKGTKTLYIKDYGENRVIYQNIDSSMMQKSSKSAEFTIKTKKWIYKLSLTKQKATRFPNISYLLYMHYLKLSPKEQKQLVKNLKILKYTPKSSNKFKIISNFTKIQNIPCSMIISGSKKECYGYNGSLLLKSTIKVMGFKKDEIVSNIFKTKVDSKLFDTSKLTIVDDKKQSLKIYKQSKKIINFLKNKIVKTKIFTKKLNSKEDYSQIIQEGIKQLDKI